MEWKPQKSSAAEASSSDQSSSAVSFLPLALVTLGAKSEITAPPHIFSVCFLSFFLMLGFEREMNAVGDVTHL